MADKRMMSRKIVESDAFYDLEPMQQALYFHLCMEADDDGFINNPKSIARGMGASIDDINALIDARFIISFSSGVVCIKHWRINNTIQKDRYKETTYKEEKALLKIKENGAYTLDTQEHETLDTQEVESLDTQETETLDTQEADFVYPQNRLDKNRLDKNSIDKRESKERENDSLSDTDTEPFHVPQSVDDLYDFLPKIQLYVDEPFKFPIEDLEVYYRVRRRDKWKNITDEDSLAQDMYLWCVRGDDYKARKEYGA